MKKYVKRKEFTHAEFMALVDEVGDCLEWKGAMRETHPLPLWNGRSVRLILWRMVRGEVREGYRLSVTCKNERCANPDHLYQRARGEEMKGTTRSAAFKAKVAKTLRAQRAVDGMSMELAREIRNSPETARAIAHRIGAHEGWVSLVRRNERWAEYVTPFAGLGARA